jgi:hypothetical protein
MSQFHNFGLPVRLENKIDDRTKKTGRRIQRTKGLPCPKARHPRMPWIGEFCTVDGSRPVRTENLGLECKINDRTKKTGRRI